MCAHFHENPDHYLEQIRAEVPRFDELQDAAVGAIPFAPARILELGFGTAETTERLLERFPETRITGLDSSPEMVFKARELGWEEMRLGRIEDPLPDGPWDLVIAVLVVHRLDDDGKRDLFRRVSEQSRALVIGDVVRRSGSAGDRSAGPGLEAEDADGQAKPIESSFPAGAEEQADWCGGEVTWTADGLAVIRATYG